MSNDTVVLNNIICNCTCPICTQLLFDPVVAADGIFYNKKCFVKYSEKYKKKLIKSPVKGIEIAKTFIVNNSMRELIINLIKTTTIFDNVIKNMSISDIIEYNLEDDLFECSKLPFITSITSDTSDTSDTNAMNNNYLIQYLVSLDQININENKILKFMN